MSVPTSLSISLNWAVCWLDVIDVAVGVGVAVVVVLTGAIVKLADDVDVAVVRGNGNTGRFANGLGRAAFGRMG